MLETIQLTKRFNGTVAVDKLDLHIEPGEVFALLGPNGAGKTTTINLFLNFLKPDSGAAKVNGLDVAQHPLETKRRLAYIPEQVTLYKNLTGVENLDYFSALARHKYSDSELRKFLTDAGLQPEAVDRRVATYSKGMRQKVGIAIAVAKQASALLLDEPTSGLDPAASYEFSQLLKKLVGGGLAILMATHDLFRAKEVATRVGIMKHSRLAVTLSTAQFSHVDLEKLYLEHMAQ